MKHDHCFHNTGGGHMLPHHMDVMCCFCEKTACLTLLPKYNIGHGPYAKRDVVEIQIPKLDWPHNAWPNDGD